MKYIIRYRKLNLSERVERQFLNTMPEARIALRTSEQTASGVGVFRK